VAEITRQRSFEVAGVHNDVMVETLPANGADESFGVRILPRTSRCGQNFFHSQRLDFGSNLAALNAVPIANKITGSVSIGERLDDLLRSPGRSRMLRHIEMQHLATTMFQHDKYEQHLHRERRHSKEVDRYHLTDMIVQESLPGLVRRPAELSQNAGDGTLGGCGSRKLIPSDRIPVRLLFRTVRELFGMLSSERV